MPTARIAEVIVKKCSKCPYLSKGDVCRITGLKIEYPEYVEEHCTLEQCFIV